MRILKHFVRHSWEKKTCPTIFTSSTFHKSCQVSRNWAFLSHKSNSSKIELNKDRAHQRLSLARMATTIKRTTPSTLIPAIRLTCGMGKNVSTETLVQAHRVTPLLCSLSLSLSLFLFFLSLSLSFLSLSLSLYFLSFSLFIFFLSLSFFSFSLFVYLSFFVYVSMTPLPLFLPLSLSAHVPLPLYVLLWHSMLPSLSLLFPLHISLKHILFISFSLWILTSLLRLSLQLNLFVSTIIT